jgi:Big-like domain-containing protein
MKNAIVLILLGSLCITFMGWVSTNLSAMAFKPASSADLLDYDRLGEINARAPSCTLSSDPNAFEPTSTRAYMQVRYYPQALDINCVADAGRGPWEIKLVAQDDDPNSQLTALISGRTSNGTLSEIYQDGGIVTYTPKRGFIGEDQFTYSVNDGTTDSNNATVKISVYPPPG